MSVEQHESAVYQIHGQDEKPMTLYAKSTRDNSHTVYCVPSWPVVFLGFEEFDFRVHRALEGRGWTISEATTGMSIVKDTDAQTSDGPCVTVGFMVTRAQLTVEKVRNAIVKANERLAEISLSEPLTTPPALESYQIRTGRFIVECFGKETADEQRKALNNLAERLRLAMLFIEEWSNWWSYALGVDDDAPMPEAEKKAAEEMAASLGKRACDMVIDNRRALANVPALGQSKVRQ